MIKKYIVSIEQKDSPRLQNFLNQEVIKPFIDEFKFFGFNAYQQSAKDYFQQAVVGRKRPLTLGEWGCAKSHLMCLQDFLDSDAKYALIFEDDAIQVYDIDLSQLPVQIEQLNLISPFFLSLGGVQMKICNKIKGELLDNTLFKRPILQVHPYFYDKMNYAYAYIVDRAMAQILLDYHQPLQVFDHWQGLSYRDVHFYMTYIFDHPNIEINTNMSYLESERVVNILSIDEKVSISKLKYQWLKWFLDKYPY